jgi:cytochrome c oxidase subunit 3
MSEATAHHASGGHLASHFEDLGQQRLASSLGMWTFLATEVLFFGGMMVGYTVYRSRHEHDWAAASHLLQIGWGTLNTAVLLTSSLTMALAVDAAKLRNSRLLQRYLALTLLFGTIFLCIKGYEYYEKFHDHHVPGPNFVWDRADISAGPVELFLSFYFVMTGCHAVHMIIGLGLLATLLVLARKGRYADGHYTMIENSGLYWHFVDIVWVFLFPLLYLIDRT